MRTFEVTDRFTGKSYGKYVAESEEAAIREMLVDVGLNSVHLDPESRPELRWVTYKFTATEIRE